LFGKGGAGRKNVCPLHDSRVQQPLDAGTVGTKR
jgi:hypothetical protein